jgi:hypothetical protein
MRLLLKSLAAGTGAAAVIAIAGCGPASINASQAANASGVTAETSSAASATGDSSQVAGAGAASSPAAGQVTTSAAATSPLATALSIVMTLPVHHPAQTTALIAGRLSEPGNGGAPLAGRVVWLQRLGAGGWLLFRSGVTGPDGRVAFGVHVVVGAAFRLVYAGTPNLARAVSAVRIVIA